MRDFNTFGLLPGDRPFGTIEPIPGTFLDSERSELLNNNTPPGFGVKRRVDPRLGLIPQSLAKSGYGRFGPDFIGGSEGDIRLARDAFIASVRDLPIDPCDPSGNRRRRYQVFHYHPWCHDLESKPPVFDPVKKEWVMRFFQSSDLNPELGGKARALAPFTIDQRINAFLKSVIEKCQACLDLEPTDSLIIGAHLIQLVAPAASSPNLFHRDGEKWTWAFLLERNNVVGGENFIATTDMANRALSEVPEDRILERFTLERPFEGWVVQDDKVSHYVSPVTLGEANTFGWRTVLLLDFCRAIPELV
jgi:hypothetical protein